MEEKFDHKCEECRKLFSGPWAVVIFPDFSKGWCSEACWRAWTKKQLSPAKPRPNPIPFSNFKY